MNRKDKIEPLKVPIRVSNYLVEAQFDLTTMEQRILMYICAFLIKTTDETLKPCYMINVKRFCEAFDISHNRIYEFLEDASDRLIKRTIRIHYPHKSGFQFFPWVRSAEYKSGEGEFYLSFDDRMIPYLTDLKSLFTQINFEDVASLSSKYSLRFLLLAAESLPGIKKRTMELKEICEHLNLNKAYKTFGSLRQKVLEPARKEITEKTRYTFEYTPLKNSRRVYALEFIFDEQKHNRKKDEEWEDCSLTATNLIKLGISKPKAEELESAENAEYLEWVIPKIKASKNKAHKKGDSVGFHQAYCLKIIEDERANYIAESERDKEEQSREQEKQEKRNALQFKQAEETLQCLYADYENEEVFKALDRQKDKDAILDEFEAYLLEQLEKSEEDIVPVNDYRLHGIDFFTVREFSIPFLKDRLKIDLTFDQFKKQEGYTIKMRDKDYVLLKQNESVPLMNR